MTIASQTRTAGPFTGTGLLVSYPFAFKVFATSDLLITQTDTQGNLTTPTLGGGYTVVLNADQNTSPGGTITPLVALPTGYVWNVTSAVSVTQGAALTNAGGFFPQTIENALDRLTILIQQALGLLLGTVRAPEITPIAPLPTIAQRANQLLSFDSFGNPIAVAPVAGTATALAVLLASSAGANNVGLPSGTLAAFLANMTPLSKYGTLHNDGSTDDAAVLQAAAASGAAVIDARNLNLRIASTINIPSNQTWLLHGTTISLTGTTLKVFSAVSVDNWNLVGPFKIVGDGSTAGSAYGIFVSNCTKWRVIDPTFVNIRGFGMWNDPGASTRLRSDGGSVINPVFDGCYVGWQDAAGTGAEFCSIVNLRAIRCTTYGVVTCAGNTIFTGGHIVDNVAVGMLVTSGANAAHGMATGLNIDHNGTFGLQCTQVLNGMSFTGGHFYQSAIWLDRSAGINISGGHLDCIVYNYKDGSSGQNLIENMYCPGGYGVCRQAGANNGHDQLIIRGCFGPGAYSIAGGGVDTTGVTINDPATCYAAAQRDAGTTQALTSGLAATLLWVSSSFPDRRLVLTLGSGTFTVPANQAGLYHFDLDYLFGGTAMSAIASFVEIKVNATSRKIFFPTIFGTTKLQIQGSVDLYLAAGDVVTTVGTITGTTPTFGDGTWPSSFEVRRIA